MPDWSVWRSSDLITWQKVTVILPNQTYIGSRGDNEAWASDVARTSDGKYVFFFSHGGMSMGVMSASSPSLDDARDALGRPLVSSSRQPETPSGVWVTNQTRGAYDPSLLVDDDGVTYVSFGVRDTLDSSKYLIARLEPSLTSLAEEPQPVVFLPRADGAEMPSDDKSSLHKWKGIYYLSAGSYYSTASSPHGPFMFRGSSNPQLSRGVNDSRTFGDTSQAHGRFFMFRGQWFHVWCEFLSQNNTGKVVPKGGYYRWRDSWMTYPHYTAAGDLVDDWNYLDLHGSTGVGSYHADWPRIEAEWFMAANDCTKVQINSHSSNESFAVAFAGSGSSLDFPNVKGLSEVSTVTLSFSKILGAGTVSLWPNPVDVDHDTPLASCKVLVGAMQSTCPFKFVEGTSGVTLKYETSGHSSGGIQLDWWALTST